MLKRMNSNYPENTSDYDERFLDHLVKAIFPKQNLIKASKKKTTFGLNRQHFQFLEGKIKNFSPLNIF